MIYLGNGIYSDSGPDTMSHFGVLGMKWGVRKNRDPGNSRGNKIKQKMLKKHFERHPELARAINKSNDDIHNYWQKTASSDKTKSLFVREMTKNWGYTNNEAKQALETDLYYNFVDNDVLGNDKNYNNLLNKRRKLDTMVRQSVDEEFNKKYGAAKEKTLRAANSAKRILIEPL